MSMSDDNKNEHLKLTPASAIRATPDISALQEMESHSIEIVSEVKETHSIDHILIDSLDSVQHNPSLPVLSKLNVTHVDQAYLQKVKIEIREGHYDINEGLERILNYVLSSTFSIPPNFVKQMMPQFKALLSLYPELKDQILGQLKDD